MSQLETTASFYFFRHLIDETALIMEGMMIYAITFMGAFEAVTAAHNGIEFIQV